jgi:hypothetical protein
MEALSRYDQRQSINDKRNMSRTLLGITKKANLLQVFVFLENMLAKEVLSR